VGEYEALVNGLHITTILEIRRLNVRGDSRLVVDQVMKESSYHDPRMAAYSRAVHLLEDKFDGLKLNHVARRFNEAADELVKLASGQEPVPFGVFANHLHKPLVTCQDSMQDGNEAPAPASGASPTPVPTEPEVVEIVEDLAPGPNPCQTGVYSTSTT
jgi:hypothetical protein